MMFVNLRYSLMASSTLKRYFMSSFIRYCSGSHAYGGGSSPLCISNEVASALSRGKAVVALESTIITHGMPYPNNLECANEVEGIIRACGAVPATIAVMDGRCHVGLSTDQLERLAHVGRDAMKTSRRDLALVMARGVVGSTTVSATSIAARIAGITTFVTGGIGGVHRDVEATMDISADLTELGRTPIAVVCGGAKAILDLPRTLEFLETQGVTVATVGDSDLFPAFFTRRTTDGLRSMCQISVEESARVIDANMRLGLNSGMVFAVPIPEESAADAAIIDDAIKTALHEADEQGVSGKNSTPFLLQRISELTDGKSLSSNVALIKNNARVGANIAVALAKLQRARNATVSRPTVYYPVQPSQQHIEQQEQLKEQQQDKDQVQSTVVETPLPLHISHDGIPEHVHRGLAETMKNSSVPSKPVHDYVSGIGRPLVVGGIVMDVLASSGIHTTRETPGTIRQYVGGVALNMAECLLRLGTAVRFVSVVGQDPAAAQVAAYCEEVGLGTAHFLHKADCRTGSYVATLDDSGEVTNAIVDMDIFDRITSIDLEKILPLISASPFVCVDSNFNAEALQAIAKRCFHSNVPLWFEPTSPTKAARLLEGDSVFMITYASPNIEELSVMYNAIMLMHPARRQWGLRSLALNKTLLNETHGSMVEAYGDVIAETLTVLEYIPNVLVTMNKAGVLVGRRISHGQAEITHIPAPDVNVVNTTGAGDCLAAGTVYGLIHNLPILESVGIGVQVAALTLQENQAVSHIISPDKLQ